MQKCDIKNMLYKTSLKSRALSVILYLLDRANKDLVCFPSIKTISKDLNISVSTTKRALNSLVETGFIEKNRKIFRYNRQTNIYLYVINVENIENVKNVEKLEKVTEQEEKEVLKIFKQAKTENIEYEEKEVKNTIVNKTNLSIDIEKSEQVDRLRIQKIKKKIDRHSLSINIDKNLIIL